MTIHDALSAARVYCPPAHCAEAISGKRRFIGEDMEETAMANLEMLVKKIDFYKRLARFEADTFERRLIFMVGLEIVRKSQAMISRDVAISYLYPAG